MGAPTNSNFQFNHYYCTERVVFAIPLNFLSFLITHHPKMLFLVFSAVVVVAAAALFQPLLVVAAATAPTSGSSSSSNGNTYTWVDARPFLRGTGFGASEKGAYFDRLPAAAQNTTRSVVWSLSRDSAGMYLAFTANPSVAEIAINLTYVYDGANTMWHFPSTGVAGVDLYAYDMSNSSWRWLSTTHNNAQLHGPVGIVSRLQLAPSGTSGAGKPTRYRLHLPLYNGVADLKLGCLSDPAGSSNGPPPCSFGADPVQPAVSKPVVWYGTSIAQGGVASRPGMAFTNIISRAIDAEILNFGFSGNCLMEPGVVQWLVQIDAALFVVDCIWNMQAEMVHQRAIPLLRQLRAKRPTMPIILAEGTPAGGAWADANIANEMAAKNGYLRAAYEQLKGQGDANLYYVESDSLYAFPDSIAVDPLHKISPTVMGTHPTDLGQMAVALFYQKFLPPIILKSKPFVTSSFPPTSSGTKTTTSMISETTPGGRVASKSEAMAHAGEVSRLEAAAAAQQALAGHVTVPDDNTFYFTDVETSEDLVVMGRAFNLTAEGAYYSRLPGAAQGVVRDAVWNLSLDNTGMFVPFVTNSSLVVLRWQLANAPDPLWHMPASGTSGLDMYCEDANGTYVFVGAARGAPAGGSKSSHDTSMAVPAPGHCVVNLPLRNRLLKLEIGVHQGSLLAPDSRYGSDGVTVDGNRPIVWYGTSIDQGGVASRAGTTYTQIMSRQLKRMVLNLGFAGNGVMEISVAQFLVQIDAAIYVIDCLPNMNAATITNRTQPLVHYIRTHRPDTPILLTAGTTYGDHWVEPAANGDKRAALKVQYDALVAAGVENLHLFLNENNQLFASNPLVNPTVGGTHPSDLGHREIATYWAGHLPPIMMLDS